MARRWHGRSWVAADAAALGAPPLVPPPHPADVTRLVRHARRRARLSQRGLAERAGVRQSTIAEIEMGRVDPKAGTLAKLLSACDCRLAVLPVQAIMADETDQSDPGRPTQGSGLSDAGDPAYAADATGAQSPSHVDVDDTALEARLDREPADRVADAGPHAARLVASIIAAARATGTEPIIIGELAELIWGADRHPMSAQVCVGPADRAPVRHALDAAAHAADPRSPTGPGDPTGPSTAAGDRESAGYADAQLVDVQGRPPGTDGWADLRRAAAPVHFGFREVLVASLDDLLRVRRARGGPADARAIAELEALVLAVERTEHAEAAGNPRFPAHWDVAPLAHLDWLLLRGRVRKVGREQRQRSLTGFCS